DAIQATMSGSSGWLDSRLAWPVEARWRMRSRSTTTVVAPAISFAAMADFMAASTPSRVGAAEVRKGAARAETRATVAKRRERWVGMRMGKEWALGERVWSTKLEDPSPRARASHTLRW